MPKINIERDPRLFAEAITSKSSPHKLALGLDLGTTTGYAYTYFEPNVPTKKSGVAMGQWNLSAGPYDSGAIRFVRLRQFLSILMPDLVLFEDVRYTPQRGNKFTVGAIIARAANAGELFGAFKATLCTWCEENNVPCQGIGIGQIKKFATNKGNANKVEMIEACNAKFQTEFDVDDYESTGVDNIADAAFVMAMGLDAYIGGL